MSHGVYSKNEHGAGVMVNNERRTKKREGNKRNWEVKKRSCYLSFSSVAVAAEGRNLLLLRSSFLRCFPIKFYLCVRMRKKEKNIFFGILFVVERSSDVVLLASCFKDKSWRMLFPTVLA